MPVAQVTVKDFWLPSGKKRYVLKTDRDELYGVPEKLKNEVQKGGSYELIYTNDEWQGKTYKVVAEVNPVGGTPANTIRSTTSSAPAVSTKDEDIATLAIAKEQLNKISPGDVEQGFHVLKSSALMWRKFKTWQKLGPQTVKEELNDEIPFP